MAPRERVQTVNIDDLFISCDRSLLDLEWIVKNIKIAYWGHWRCEKVIRKSVENSLCYGLYWRDPTTDGAIPTINRQIGLARLVTDYSTFSYLCDVIIDPNYRGLGYGKFLMSIVVQDPVVANMPCLLVTKDAQKLYHCFGYEPLTTAMRRIPKK